MASYALFLRAPDTGCPDAEVGMDDGPVCERLLREGVLIRGGTEFGLPRFARITVAREPVMRRTAELVGEAVDAAD